jgi:hypothetical protein
MATSVSEMSLLPFETLACAFGGVRWRRDAD